MDQQHASGPATGYPDIHAGDAGLSEPRGMPAAIVLRGSLDDAKRDRVAGWA